MARASNIHWVRSACRYLRAPLATLDAELNAQKKQKYAAVILLDALDEAADGKAGFEAVSSFVARE